MAFQIENCGPHLLLIHTNDRAHAQCYYAFDLISMWFPRFPELMQPGTTALKTLG